MRNHSYENDFDLHENETACRTHFHVKGFARRLVLKQRHKRTRKWPIAHIIHLSMSTLGEGGATHGNLTVTHIPRVGILTWHHAFDLSISKSSWEVNHLFLRILTIIFCPGVGILIIFFRKSQNPDPMPDPSSSVCEFKVSLSYLISIKRNHSQHHNSIIKFNFSF